MAVLKVAKSGNPVLRRKAESVDIKRLAQGDDELQTFIDDMVDTMRAEDGVGLAAPQVDRSLQIVVMECDTNKRYPDRPNFGLTVLVNPTIVFYDEEKDYGWEACLSLPGLHGWVPRSRSIRIDAHDREGRAITLEAEGFPAVAAQHEIDHLNGILYVDRMDGLEKLCYQEEFEQFWIPKQESASAGVAPEVAAGD